MIKRSPMFSLPGDIIPVIISAALRTMGLSQDPHYINYHRVLSRAVWNSLQSHFDQSSSDGHKPQNGNRYNQQERVEAVRVFQFGLIKLESS